MQHLPPCKVSRCTPVLRSTTNSSEYLLGQPLRQELGMMQSLLKLAGLDWPLPGFSTDCCGQKTLQV
ncbi:MAG: transposase [Propionivibrio sp.]|nr:transposase [Propionivibrio sp.]